MMVNPFICPEGTFS